MQYLQFLQYVELNLGQVLPQQKCLAASTMMQLKMKVVKQQPIMQVVLLAV